MNKMDKVINKDEILTQGFAKDWIADKKDDGYTQEEAENSLYNMLKGEGAIFSKKIGEVEIPKTEWTQLDWEHFNLNGSVPTVPVIQEFFKTPDMN